ncbi:MAG: hypothetical protein JSR66_30340 [Proteobacteria bacterium]|nr:hypothetical protein [Pseudomonadota bacterium]
MVRSWSVCTLSAVIGICSGWILHGFDSPDANQSAAPATAQVAPPLFPQPQAAAQSGLDLAQLHAAIREELAAVKSQPVNERQPAPAAKAGAPASPELIAQRREAVQDLQAMITAGEWGNAERAQFQQKFLLLDPEQARQVLQQITMGLNNGTIHSQIDLPL